MTKEQEKAIEKLEHVNRYYDCNNYYSRYELDCIEMALKMLKEKDKEIEKLKKHNKELLRKLRNRVKEAKELKKYSLYKKEFKTLNSQLKKKDKIINLMAEYIATLDIEEDICSKIENEHCDKMNFGECEDCIKQHFKSKAEKE